MSINKKIMLVVALVLVFSVMSVILLIIPSLNLLCIPLLFQNILIPVIATRFLLSELQEHFHSNSGAIGALIGIATGFIPATTIIVVTLILIRLNGGELVTPFSKLAFSTITVSMIATWFGLIMLSALTGLIASIRFRRR